MALTLCPDCGRQVSDVAAACPGCGRATAMAKPRKFDAGPALFGILIGILIGAAVGEFVGSGGISAIAQPFSPVRNKDALTFGVYGAPAGLVIGLLVSVAAHLARKR